MAFAPGPPARSFSREPVATRAHLTRMAASGIFLVLEGGEGVGKTTQWQRLATRLTHAGHDVVALREPGGTPAGDVLRSVLLDPESTLAPEAEALMFAASRAQLVNEVIRPALLRGAVVLVDRFLLSTFAYQGSGRGLPLDALRACNHLATGGLSPHLTLLLSLPLDEALTRMRSRGGSDRMERESLAFHERVAQAFLRATERDWQVQHPDIGDVVTVDATGSPDDVTTRCLERLAERWPERFSAALDSERADVAHGAAHG